MTAITPERYIRLGIAAITLFFISTLTTAAQVAELRGQALLRTPDGQLVPLAGAQIDVVRTDLNAVYNTRSNKKGEWVFAGLPYAGTYVVAVSHPTAVPKWVPNVRAGRDEIVEITVEPGDGKRLTFDEIRAAAGLNTPSAADAAKREELARKTAEIEAQNQKITAANEIIARTFKAGNDELNAASAASRTGKPDAAIQRYTAAVAQYDEGLAADPLQPAILTNKAVALKGRGAERFNAAVRSKALSDADKATAMQKAKADFKAAAETSSSSVDLIKASAVPTDPQEIARYNGNRYAAFVTYAESMRLYVTRADATQVDAGRKAYAQYISLETDPVKKRKARVDLAQMLLDVDRYGQALAEFVTVLGTAPDDPQANLGAGMAIIRIGDKTKLRQGLIYLKHFLDVAPESDPMRADVNDLVALLETENNPD